MRSKDYDKLYKLICDGEIVPCFVDWSYGDGDINRDVAKVQRLAKNTIDIMARGIGYGYVYQCCLKGKNEKEAFIDECNRLNLEYYT